jgi:single-strand DNA-binding protein
MATAPVTLVGRLTQEPELKFLGNGTPKLTFSLAVNHFWKDSSGETQEKTHFFNVIAWRNLAEDAAAILEKGLQVIVQGRLEQESWDDKETGKKQSRVVILADEIGATVRGISAVSRKAAGDGQQSGARAGSAVAKAQAKVAPKVVEEEDEPF